MRGDWQIVTVEAGLAFAIASTSGGLGGVFFKISGQLSGRAEANSMFMKIEVCQKLVVEQNEMNAELLKQLRA